MSTNIEECTDIEAGNNPKTELPEDVEPQQAENLKPEELVDIFSKAHGLTTSEYEKALAQHGYNEVLIEDKPVWMQILSRYLGIVPLFISTTAILSAAIKSNCPLDGNNLEPCNCSSSRDWASFALLFFELNLVVYADYAGSKSSGDAIKKLQEASASKVSVLRDGAWTQVATRELVPGDVVAVTIGMTIPADGIFLSEGEPLKLDYSSLTGEPLPEKKARGEFILSGAVVLVGEGEMYVNKTGKDSSLGTTQALIAEAKQEKESGGELANTLSKVIVFLAVFGLVVSVFVGAYSGTDFGLDAGEAIKAAFVLLSTILPVTMPLILTTTLAVGAQELADDDAVVQRFSAIPEFANMDILCSDKTGTLTLGKMTVIKEESIVFHEDVTIDEMMELALVASRIEHSDAIDAALTKHHADPAAVLEKYDIKKFIPFDPATKRVTVVATKRETGKELVIVKGAPPVLFGYAGIDQDTYARAQVALTERSERGYKTLAVCVQIDENEWKLLGLISILDPPRSDTMHTVQKCNELGVEVKMITGDQRLIALEVARQLKLPNLVIYGKDVFNSNSHVVDRAGGFGALCEKSGGFAGVSPEHKHRVVTALQGLGHAVGMTGDGVNDAPALSIANVGIAVAGATDAARGASDIVLQQEGLSTIVKALYGSRKIFKRIESYLTYRLSSSFVFGFAFTLIYVASGFNFPTWTLILMSLLNDFAVSSASKDQVVIQRVPVSLNIRKTGTVAFVMGTITSVHVWGFIESTLRYRRASGPHFWGLNPTDSDAQAFSNCEVAAVAFLALIISIQLNLFIARSPKPFFIMKTEKDEDGHFTSVPPPSLYVVGSVGISLTIATFIAVYWEDNIIIGSGFGMQGIGWRNAGLIWAWCLTFFVVTDLAKFATLQIWGLVANDKYGSIYYKNILQVGFSDDATTDQNHRTRVSTLRGDLAQYDSSSNQLAPWSSVRSDLSGGLALLGQENLSDEDKVVTVQDVLLASGTLEHDPNLLRVVSQMVYKIGQLQARLDEMEGKEPPSHFLWKKKNV